MTNQTKRTVLFPINQDEQAVQAKADYLLAQDVFEKIADLLGRGLAKIKRLASEQGLDDLDLHRAHEAILLQGARGSGKSAVLVNLALYLKERQPVIADELLILKPIDPTLLENGEDMFLDVFIAALVRDKQIKAKLDLGGREAEMFYDQLCKVGSALESSQTQKEQHGMDRVRALIGGSGIAEQVHKLFQCALKLTCKKLIVLLIDDVDTALQHAYEKIEIVRKYLVSPCLIPLISGDLALYDDVIWRDFHGRLLDKSKAERPEALARAKRLSIDYQRKILPLPRRIIVPSLASYLNDPELLLVDKDTKLISFPVFKYWLEAVLNERVNGVENSYLPLPINTARDFAQLVSHVQKLLPGLTKILTDKTNFLPLELRRLSFMPPKVAQLISVFAKEFASARNITRKADRNAAFANAYAMVTSEQSLHQNELANGLGGVFVIWQEALKTYFRHHQNGGVAYITMEANSHFRRCATEQSDERHSVFDTILFNPHRHQKHNEFTQSADIRAQWGNYLDKRMPVGWVKNIPKMSMLPYANPEHGFLIVEAERQRIASLIERISILEQSEDAELIYRLITYFNFHNAINRGTLAVTGRIFELLITSLIRKISVAEVYDMISRSPFYSIAERVEGGTFELAVDEIAYPGNAANHAIGDALSRLVEAINAWRDENFKTPTSPPNAWLIYNVTNKFFNTPHRSDPVKPNPQEKCIDNVFGTAVKAFNTVWNAFANFEKGPVFGIDLIIVDMAISDADKDFTQSRLYTSNILPFVRLTGTSLPDKGAKNNQAIGAYTTLLASHPLKNLLQHVYNEMKIHAEFIKDEDILLVNNGISNKLEVISDEKLNAKVNGIIRVIDSKVTGSALVAIKKQIADALGENAERAFELANSPKYKGGRYGLSDLGRLLAKIAAEEKKIAAAQVVVKNSPAG